MKLLIITEHANYGGHVQSALTTARELKVRGHDVIVASGEGVLVAEIKSTFVHYTLPYYLTHSGRQTYFTFKSLETIREIAKVVKKESIEMIHAFDARSYIASVIVSLFYCPISVTGTLCGGITPFYNIPLSEKFIVFSHEQKDKMCTKFKWNKENVCVCSNRVDMKQFDFPANEIETLCDEFSIDPKGKYIMMITTFLDVKKGSIINTLNAIGSVLDKHRSYTFIIIGGKGEFFNEAKHIGAEINRNIGREAINFTGLMPNAFRMLSVASIVIGLGRSAFEGMAYEKPTLVVGDNGFAGTVSPGKIEALYYYNFSGRNQKSLVPENELTNEINRLIEDEEYYDSVKSFGKSFLMKNISIQSGIRVIEEVYQANSNFNYRKARKIRIMNLCKILMPILFDNYYNQVKIMLK